MISVQFIQGLGMIIFAIGLPVAMAGAAMPSNKMMAYGALVALIGMIVAGTAGWAS